MALTLATLWALRISSAVASLIPRYLTLPSSCNFFNSLHVSSMGMVLSTYESKYMSTFGTCGEGAEDLLDADSKDRCGPLGDS